MKFMIYGIFFLIITTPGLSAGWSLSNSPQVIGNKFGTDTIYNLFYLYTGVHYQDDDWNLSATIPVVALSDKLVNVNPTNNIDAGIGDLYIFADYNIIKDTNFIGFTLEGILKLPTSTGISNFGTGKTDFGLNVFLRKYFGNYVIIANIGYYHFGNSTSDNISNPLMYGAGIGKFFGIGDYSILLYYGAYSQVLSGFPAPRQISLGFNDILAENATLSFIASSGLSIFSPLYAFSARISYGI
jgi:hypothetical protein